MPRIARPSPTDAAWRPPIEGLRATIEALAPLERSSGTAGEREAADWIAARLEDLGCDASVDEESAYDSFAVPVAGMSAIGAAAGVMALSRRGRLAGAALSALAAAGLADDVANGARWFRRATMKSKPTWNVVAEAGDRAAARTLVVLAHHDAARSGRVFDQSLQRWLGDRFPGIIERIDTSLPLWWPVVGAPAGVSVAALRRQSGLTAAAASVCLLATAALADIARSPIVPGANDNLTAVAALVAVAEYLREQPLTGLRVLLVSCGSEETLQGGARAFAARHFAALDREQTWVLNLETIGSPELMMLEGEGTLVMEDYHGRGFRDLVARAADRARIPVRRGMRARSSTDAVITSRAGYPTATLSSMDRYKALSNYHQMTDTPDNVRYETVAAATGVVDAVARELAG